MKVSELGCPECCRNDQHRPGCHRVLAAELVTNALGSMNDDCSYNDTDAFRLVSFIADKLHTVEHEILERSAKLVETECYNMTLDMIAARIRSLRG